MQKYIILSLMLLMIACSSQVPVPTDHYYRLPELSNVNIDKQLVQAISVITFQTDGLHKERAILYSKDGIELNQYHYHHWTDSPQRLLQQRLAERLRMSKLSRVVLTTFEGDSELIIKGYIKSFERLTHPGDDSVKVALELRVDTNHENLPVLYKEYSQTVKINNSSMISVINAFNSAVNTLYDEFYIDLKVSLNESW